MMLDPVVRDYFVKPSLCFITQVLPMMVKSSVIMIRLNFQQILMVQLLELDRLRF